MAEDGAMKRGLGAVRARIRMSSPSAVVCCSTAGFIVDIVSMEFLFPLFCSAASQFLQIHLQDTCEDRHGIYVLDFYSNLVPKG